MKIAVVGSSQDVGGFALAGLRGVVAETGPEVEEALRAAAVASGDSGLLLLSAGAARLAPDVLESISAREGAPVLLVLPESASP